MVAMNKTGMDNTLTELLVHARHDIKTFVVSLENTRVEANEEKATFTVSDVITKDEWIIHYKPENLRSLTRQELYRWFVFVLLSQTWWQMKNLP